YCVDSLNFVEVPFRRTVGLNVPGHVSERRVGHRSSIRSGCYGDQGLHRLLIEAETVRREAEVRRNVSARYRLRQVEERNVDLTHGLADLLVETVHHDIEQLLYGILNWLEN